jgi:hypothetical protein
MPLILSLADIRDVVIIVWGTVAAVFFLVGLIVVLVLGFSVKGLLNMVKDLLNEDVKPALTSVRDAADTLRGTTEFVGRTTVSPVVKFYGTFAGIKKGLSVLSGVRGKSK